MFFYTSAYGGSMTHEASPMKFCQEYLHLCHKLQFIFWLIPICMQLSLMANGVLQNLIHNLFPNFMYCDRLDYLNPKNASNTQPVEIRI